MTGNRMGARKVRLALGIASFLWLCAAPLQAQFDGQLFVRPIGEVLFPLDTYTDSTSGQTKPLYSIIGLGGGSIVDFKLYPWFVPFVRAQYSQVSYSGGNSLQLAEADLGAGYVYELTDRFALRLDGLLGLSQIILPGLTGSGYSAGTRLSLDYRLTPAFSLSVGGGYSTYFGSATSILSALATDLSLTYDLSTLGGEKPKLTIEDVKLGAVFPSLYAYYDENPFGTIKIINREDASITNVIVSFNVGHYMDQPKVCGQFANLKKGQEQAVPVKALFTDAVLNITQGLQAKGEIIVEYTYLGASRVVRQPVDFQMHHRNAIAWSDDRRAAAFVSPTNPAALWFSRFAAGIVNDRQRAAINKPLQYAIGLFEAERLYGLNYVLVPSNDYSVKHGIKDYIDSVQFPHQTLTNRGGDCSDLAILFASLMQSIGVDAAFITIPGHIYAAFDTGLDQQQARETFSDSGLVIFRNGRSWIPVEITMIKDGFLKAWRVGAKEWIDNIETGTAAFYSLPDCWKTYPSTSVPDVNPRFILPAESSTATAFDVTLDRYVAREIVPQVQTLQAKIAHEDPPVQANALGILYASYGLLGPSWKYLSEAAKSGFPGAWANLGNLAFLQKNFQLGIAYFQYALALDSSNDVALLGLARCQYELENFSASDKTYASLRQRNPQLASQFGYLGSVFGGEGRAWSFSERFAGTRWVQVAPVSVATSAPEPPAILETLPTQFDKLPVRPPRPIRVTAASPPVPSEPEPSEVALVVPTVELQPAPEQEVFEPEQLVAAQGLVALAPPVNTPPEAPAEEIRVSPAVPHTAVDAGPFPAEFAVPEVNLPVWVAVERGFLSPIQGPGQWLFDEDVVQQVDPNQFYAKILSPVVQTASKLRYSFTTRSRGRGWVGVGLHVLVGRGSLHNGFGEGQSWLIWLTRDPVHFKDNVTRVQIYHSISDSRMDLVAQTPVAESIFQTNRLAVELDSEANTISVALNGTDVLKTESQQELGKGTLVALRSIDRAEFKDFLVEAEQ